MRDGPLPHLLSLVIVLVLLACDGEPVAQPAPTATLPLATTDLPPTVSPTTTRAATATATPARAFTPSATAVATPLPGRDWLAFETYRDGNGEIYLLDTTSGELVNLTRHPADDRAPAWRPDGGALAFESHRDGNWEIYLLELAEGRLTRLTDDPDYDGAPAWSPDGRQLAFETYRDGNLEIYVLEVSDTTVRRLTDDPAGDYGPAWSPKGSTIAFTSWRDGNKEVYTIPADGGEATNLTQNPADDEDPVWSSDGSEVAFVSWRDVDLETGNRNAEIYRLALDGTAARALPCADSAAAGGCAVRLTENPWPDLDPAWDGAGRLVWVAYDPGAAFETYDPFRPGDYHLYRSGKGEPERLSPTAWDDRHPAPAPAQMRAPISLDGWLAAGATPSPTESVVPLDNPLRVLEMPSILASPSGPSVIVNELVVPSLAAWQQDILAATGWDFLHVTLGSWRPVDSVRKKAMYQYDYGFLSWHKAGRALDVALEYKVEGVDQMLVSREDLGHDVYWRMFLKTARQDGTQGEPLKDNPWRYWWHIVADEEPEAYAAGGKRMSIPAGYYADVTAIAKRHGWERIASYRLEGDYHWSTDSNGTEYWHYERTDGLVWWDAMRQIYPDETLLENVGWEIGLQRAQSEAMMQSKGIPTPSP